MMIAGLACAAALALSLNSLRAQTNAAPPPAAPSAPAPRQPGAQTMPMRPSTRAMTYQRALVALRQARTELKLSQENLEGHKETAIAACDKAIEELSAVAKLVGPAPGANRMMPPPGAPPAPATAPEPAPTPGQ